MMSKEKDKIEFVEGISFEGYHFQQLKGKSCNPDLVNKVPIIISSNNDGILLLLLDLSYDITQDHKQAAIMLKDYNLRNHMVNIERIDYDGHEKNDDKFRFFKDPLTNNLYLICRGTYVAADLKGINEMGQALKQRFTYSRPSESQDTLDFIKYKMPNIENLDLHLYNKFIIVGHSAHGETAHSAGVYLDSIGYKNYELKVVNPWAPSIDEKQLKRDEAFDSACDDIAMDIEFPHVRIKSQEKEEKEKNCERDKLRKNIAETLERTLVYRNDNDIFFSVDTYKCTTISPLDENKETGIIAPHQLTSFLKEFVDMEIREDLEKYYKLYLEFLLYDKTGIISENMMNSSEEDMILIFSKLQFEGNSKFKEIPGFLKELATGSFIISQYSISQELGLYNVNKNQLFIPIKVNEYYILEKRDFELILQVYDLMKKGNMVTGYTDGSNSLLINTSANGVGFNYTYDRDSGGEGSSNAGKVVLAIVASFAAIEVAVQISDRLIGKETKPLGQRVIQPLIAKSFGAYQDPKLNSFKDKSFNGTYESTLFEDAELKMSIYYYTLEYKAGVFEIGGIDYTENATGLIVVSDGYVHDVRRFKVPLGKDIDNPDEVIQQCIEEEIEKAVADLAKLYHSEKDLPFNHYFVSTLKKNAELKISKHYFKVKSINKNFENGDDDYIERVPCFIELSDGVISHTHNFTVKLSKEDKYNVDKIIQESFEREMEIAMSDYTKVYQYVTRYYKNEINILEKEFNKDVSNLKKKRIINNTFIPIIGKNMTKEIRVHVLEKLDKFLDPMIENDDKFIKILEVHDIEISKVKSNELQELEDNFKKSAENISNPLNEIYESMELKKESGVWSSLKDGKGFDGRSYTKYKLITTYPDGKKRISTQIRYHNDPENNKVKIHYKDDLENEECIKAWKKEVIMNIIRESEEISSDPKFNPFIPIEEEEPTQKSLTTKEMTSILAKKSYYNTVFQIPNTIVNAAVDFITESIVSDAKYVMECNEYGYRVELRDNLYYIIGITKDDEGMTLKKFKENTYLVKIKFCKQIAEYYNFDVDKSLSDKEFVEIVEKKYYDSKSLMEKLISQMNNNPLLQKILLPLINYFLQDLAGSIFDIATSCGSNRNCMGLYGTYRNADGIGYCVSNCTPNEYNFIIAPLTRFLLYSVGNKDRINSDKFVNYQNIHILSNIINIGISTCLWKTCLSTPLYMASVTKSSLVITRNFLKDYDWIKKLDSYFKIINEIPNGLLIEHKFTNGVYSNLSKEFKAFNKFVVEDQLLDKIEVDFLIDSRSKILCSKKHQNKTTNTNALRKISGFVNTGSTVTAAVSQLGIVGYYGWGLFASSNPLFLVFGASTILISVSESGSWNKNIFTCELCKEKFYIDDLGITETQTDIKKFTFCKHCSNKWLTLKNEIRNYYLVEIYSKEYKINKNVTGFFESISYKMRLNGDNYKPKDIRWESCKYIEENFNIDNKEKYIKEMEKLTTEPDIKIIKAVSMRYGINIIINDFSIEREDFNTTILLVNCNGKYYPSDIKIKNSSDVRLDKMKNNFNKSKNKLNKKFKEIHMLF